MFVVTNRSIEANEEGLEQFGKHPNTKGNNELRLANVTRSGSGYRVEFLDDTLSAEETKACIRQFDLDIDPEGTYGRSLKVACDLVARSRENKRHILFFVHGYNNDMKALMDSAFDLQSRYDVEVLPFSWPANGGGWLGKMSYLDDKRDARASAGALERTLKKMREYFLLISQSSRTTRRKEVETKYPDNPEKRDALLAELLIKDCRFTINALFHSMGNYLYKQMLKSSINEGNELLFDNVVLCQADTNTDGHPEWVDRIAHKRRVFVTLNEDDYALRMSRIKPGDAQRARLGHYLKQLNSQAAHYINLTDASWVQESHSPFREPADRNEGVAEFFKQAFSGKPAEKDLRYRPEGNWYEIK